MIPRSPQSACFVTRTLVCRDSGSATRGNDLGRAVECLLQNASIELAPLSCKRPCTEAPVDALAIYAS